MRAQLFCSFRRRLSSAVRVSSNESDPVKTAVLKSIDLHWRANIKWHFERLHRTLNGSLYLDHGHPIFNFLFTYYFSFNKNILKKYSPGVGVMLPGATSEGYPDLASSSYGNPFFDLGYCWDLQKVAIPAKKKRSAEYIWNILTAIDSKPPSFCCYGLHEWAMLYDPSGLGVTNNDRLRKFQSLPLRLSMAAVKDVIESSTIRCTHFDAFRSFTASAKPLNSIPDGGELSRHSRSHGSLQVMMPDEHGYLLLILLITILDGRTNSFLWYPLLCCWTHLSLQ